MTSQSLFNAGIALIFAGFAIVFIAVILLFLTSVNSKVKVRGGGAVVIGPFPIVFGTDKESVRTLLILTIGLIALLALFAILSHNLFRSG
jgi:uncharacterized protein (TIGR00304 family)